LWNEGGIARVFGRPQILEVVKADEASDSEFEGNDDGEEVDSKFTAGTYLFPEAVEKRSLWLQHATTPHDAFRRQEEISTEDRPNPNLSLNIGFTRPGDKTRLCAAVTGATLQIGESKPLVVKKPLLSFFRCAGVCQYYNVPISRSIFNRRKGSREVRISHDIHWDNTCVPWSVPLRVPYRKKHR
jgi:hypothetical protein